MRVLIPARLDSSRLANKLIAKIGGKEVLRLTIEGLLKQGFPAQNIIIVTDSLEIVSRVNFWGLGVKVSYRDYKATCGSQRVHQFIGSSTFYDDQVLIWQGDEIIVEPGDISLRAWIESLDPYRSYNFYTPWYEKSFIEGAVQVCGTTQVSRFSRDSSPKSDVKGLHLGIYLLQRRLFDEHSLSIWDDYQDNIEMNALLNADVSLDLVQFVSDPKMKVVQVNTKVDLDVARAMISGPRGLIDHCPSAQ